MIALYAAGERNAELHDEARSWAEAGIVSPEQRAAVEAAHPAALVRVNVFLRLLFAAFVLLAASAAVALAGLVLKPDGLVGGLLLLAGAGGLALLADRWLVGQKRFYRCGAEEALFAAAVGFAAGGAVLLGSASGVPWQALDLLGRSVLAAGAAAAAVRYGHPLFALGAFAAVASIPLEAPGLDPPTRRALLAALAAAAAAWSHRGLARHRRGEAELLPGYRRCLEVVRLAGLASLYLAENAYLDRELPGWGGRSLWRTRASDALTLLLPVLLLAAGVRRRDRALLAFGALSAVATLVTFRYVLHFKHPALELTCLGAGLAGTGYGLLEWLRRGPDRRRGGFTAERLTASRLVGLDLEALAAMQPLALAPTQVPGAEFRPGGGRFGGGGASGDYR